MLTKVLYLIGIAFLGLEPSTAYLSKPQWKVIDHTIQHYKSSEYEKSFLQPIKNYLYINHHNWTHHYTKQFIKTNELFLRQSQKHELNLYASRGLMKAINNYNGKGNFYEYSKYYMNGELFKGISDVGPMRLLPHCYRVSKKWREKNPELYNIANKPIMSSLSPILWNRSHLGKVQNDKMIYEIHDAVKQLPNEKRLLFSLRYDVDLKKKNTLVQISQKYGYSPQTIRLKLIQIHEDIRNLIY
jgi:hypothetical protein